MRPSEEHQLQACRTFGPAVEAVYAARAFAKETVAHWGFDPTSTEIVVGELSANAILHGRSAFTVEVSEGNGHIRIQVGDENPRRPTKALVPLDARSGRGLRIVEGLSSGWGVTSTRDRGKVVWAEVSAQPQAVQADAPARGQFGSRSGVSG